jgi:hypothetical protein
MKKQRFAVLPQRIACHAVLPQRIACHAVLPQGITGLKYLKT